MKHFIFIALFFVAGAARAQQPVQAVEYAIILRLAPAYQEDSAWKPADNEAVGQHFAALQKLQAEGKLTLAGRTTNKASLGIILLKNMTEAEARKVMADDKAIQRGIMQAEFQVFYTALKEIPEPPVPPPMR